MKNYFENYKKYNKLLFNFINSGENVDYKLFTPEDKTVGPEILRWILHKIATRKEKNLKNKIIMFLKSDSFELIIHEWYDITKKDGFVNVVHIVEKLSNNMNKTELKTYRDKVLELSHKGMYNACVDYVIKKT